MGRRPLELIEFDGATVWCRGHRDGLPEFGWGDAPGHLLTLNQLRAVGLTRGRTEPVAVLRFHTPWGWTVTELYRVEDAVERPADTPGRAAARDLAMLARRTCHGCGEVRDYCMPTSTRRCRECPQEAGAAA